MRVHTCEHRFLKVKISWKINLNILLLLLNAELPLMVESFDLLNNIFPFLSILDAGYPVFNLHLANILFDIIYLGLPCDFWLGVSI